MAVNPVQFLVASNASILDGTKTITISGSVNASRVFSGTAIFLGGADNPAEAVSGTAPDGSGISTITLRNNWTQGDISNQSLVAFNTNEGLAEAISNVREIVSNASALEDLATEGLIKRISDNVYEVVNISAVGESLITANDASSQRSVLGLGSAATRNVTTSAADPDETRLMKVSDFGLGEKVATGYPNDNLDDATVPCGFYRLISGNPSLGTRPTGFSTFAYCQVQTYDASSKLQTVVDVNGKKAYRVFSSTNPNEWIYDYNSGNSANPLDYGLSGVFSDLSVSGTLSTSKSFADLSKETQFFGWSTSGNAPSDSFNVTTPLASAGVRLCASSQRYSDFLITSQGASSAATAWFKSYDGVSDSGWKEFYHSGNTNFNEVLGDGTTGIVLWGHAYSTTEIRFYVPIFFNRVASGITVQGTFSLSYFQNPTASGLDGTDIQFLSASRNVAVLRITSLSGLDMTKQYSLFAEQASAKITVNF